MTRPTALVTGAGGFIGGQVARRLASEGWRIRALVRRPAAARRDFADGVESVVADIRDADAIRAAVEAASCVVHAAGCTRMARRRTVWDVGVEGTRALHRAAHEAGVEQVVFISSFAVYSGLHTPYDERSVLTPCGDSYADAKIAAEEALLGAVRGPGVVILRPPAVYGPGSWYWSTRLALAARRGRLFVPGGGRFPIAYTFIDNLVDAVVAAIARKARGVFNVFDGLIPYADFVRPYAVMTGSRTRTLPLAAVRALAAAVSVPLRAAGWWVPFSPAALDFLVHGHRLAPAGAARAHAELGWAPLVPYPDGIHRTRRWLFERGVLV